MASDLLPWRELAVKVPYPLVRRPATSPASRSHGQRPLGRRQWVRPDWAAFGHRVLAPGLLGLTQLTSVAGERQLQRLDQILQQVESVSNLHGIGRPIAASHGIDAGAVAENHSDAGVLAQPRRKRFGLTVGQQRQRAVAIEVYQHRAVGVPLAQRLVVYAQRCRAWFRVWPF